MSETFEDYRPLLFSIAYRMLGSAMEAEDMVQETYLRYQTTTPETIQSHKALLTTIITRLCLDHLKSAQVQRETYIGPWLPEPVLTGRDGALLTAPGAHLSAFESISMAFLVLLESLSPLERAVFLLREVFDYDYADIARIVNREEVACRQLYSRAKKHVAAHRPRFEPSPEAHQRILTQFMHVVDAGDVAGLVDLLAEDVTWYSDGGGKIAAATRPLHGRDHVLRFLAGLIRLRRAGTTVTIEEVNGRAAII
ncbi:MAG: RNA polymerase sigma factor SigJ, partial [Anaerolineae bacterium]|nr:RNA polymerase sigma factor SigJ [Anaerolineae bacterium]